MNYRWFSQIRQLAGFVLVLGALILSQASSNDFYLCLACYGLLALGALVSFQYQSENSRPGIYCLGSAALFAGYLVWRALVSPVPYTARPDLCSVAAVLAVYLVTLSTFNRAGWRIALVVCLLGFAVFQVLVGLIQFGSGQNFAFLSFLQNLEVSHRASGLYANADHLAGLLELLGIYGLSITCWGRASGWKKVLCGYLTLVSYIGLALTGSRGGYLSALASLLLFGLLSLATLRSGDRALFRKMSLVAAMVAVALAAGSAILFQQNSSLRGRAALLLAPDKTRLDLWQAAVDQWKTAPWVGTGGGSYRYYGRRFRSAAMQVDPVVTHNDYLQLLSEYGLAGAAAFLFLYCSHLAQGWRTLAEFGKKRLRLRNAPTSDRLALNLGALCALAAYTVHSVFDFNLHIPSNALLVGFTFGILAEPGITAHPGEVRMRVFSGLATAAVAVFLGYLTFRFLPGEYYASRARDSLENEDPAAAVPMADIAIDYDESNPASYYVRGRALATLAELSPENRATFEEAALVAFEKARRLAPLEEVYLLETAELYDRMSRFEEAEWMFGRARSLDPRSDNISQLYLMHLELWKKGNANIE